MQNLTRVQKMVRIALFGAIIVVLAITPLGYLPVPFLPAITVTLMVTPIALGSLTIGWPAGLILGLVFGFTSFARAPFELIGQLILGHNVLLAFVACVLPRALVGLLCDVFARLVRSRPGLRKIWFYGVTGFCASAANTVLFLGFIWLVFGPDVTGWTFDLVLTVAGVNGGIEAVVNAVLVALIAHVLINPRRPRRQEQEAAPALPGAPPPADAAPSETARRPERAGEE